MIDAAAIAEFSSDRPDGAGNTNHRASRGLLGC
jgi:hypothetical protein